MSIRRYLQTIQDAAWFLYHSPGYMNKSFLCLLFKHQLIRKTINFCRMLRRWDDISVFLQEQEEEDGGDFE